MIRRLIFRLVKKHIAGTTSEAALKAVRRLNEQGMHATVTLLNDSVEDATKARYNTTAYMQFARQISRLHLNSDISVRVAQVGYAIAPDAAEKNLRDVLSVAGPSTTVWLEGNGTATAQQVMELYRSVRRDFPNAGVEIAPSYDGISALALKRLVSKGDTVRLKCYAPSGRDRQGREIAKPDAAPEKGKGRSRSEALLYKQYIDSVSGAKAKLTVMAHDASAISRIYKLDKDYKRNLIFEVPLGYSGKKVGKLLKNKLNMSVYVPYGKDWVPYLVNRLAEGKLRRIAIALLDGKGAYGGLHGGIGQEREASS